MGLSLPRTHLTAARMLRQLPFLLTSSLLLSIATGSIITLDAAAHLPIIASGTAGGIGSVMAALGALKLGALTLLHADSLDTKTRAVSKEGRNTAAKNRQLRSAQSPTGAEQEALFQLVNSLDLYSCVKRLICELKAKPEDQLTADESIFLSPFQKSEKSLPGSAKAEYDLAVSVGSHGSAVACKESFSSCPFPGSVLMAAIAQNGLSSNSD